MSLRSEPCRGAECGCSSSSSLPYNTPRRTSGHGVGWHLPWPSLVAYSASAGMFGGRVIGSSPHCGTTTRYDTWEMEYVMIVTVSREQRAWCFVSCFAVNSLSPTRLSCAYIMTVLLRVKWPSERMSPVQHPPHTIRRTYNNTAQRLLVG